MSYDYGSTTIEVRNPFKLEGVLQATRGAIVAVLGIILVFSMREQVVAAGLVTGWVKLIGAVALLSIGIYGIAAGLLRVFRFYVGRGIPADLANELTKSKTQTRRYEPAYEPQSKIETRGNQAAPEPRGREILKAMLKSRTNRTFQEPVAFLSRLLHSLEGRLLFLAPELRNVAQSLFETGILTATWALLYGLALFSGATGLAPFRGTPVPDWLGWVYVVAILRIWWRSRPTPGRTAKRKLVAAGGSTLIEAIIFAIVAPTILTYIHQRRGLPALSLSPVPWIVVLVVGGVVVCLSGLMMVFLKKPSEAPPTEVSEFRDQWQESVHPMDIFRAFDMALADVRFQEIPNRVYERIDPHLMDESKGSFSGSMMEETQPIPQIAQVPPLLDRLRRANLIVGNGLLLASAICFFVLVMRMPTAGVTSLIQWVLGCIVTLLFGWTLALVAHALYSEVRFESRLLHLSIDNGTFARSKLSTGMSIHDSTRSENEVVRSSLTPWVLCTRLQSVTYLGSGVGKLERARWVLSMERDDAFLDSVVQALRRFISSRQLVAGVTANADFGAASTIHRMNELTRATAGSVPALPEDRRPKALPAQGG